MPIDVTRIKNLLGDRVLIRPLARPEKRGGLFLASDTAKEKSKQQDLWWGVIENLGRDARYPDAYGLEVGDVVGVEFTGAHCETLAGSDGEDHCWVAEEFIALKSTGRVEAWRESKGWAAMGENHGLIPVGSNVLVRPDAEEEKRGSVYVPMTARESQKLGTCLVTSEGSLAGDALAPLHVTKGSRVLFGRYSGQWAKLDEDLLVMKQEDVIAEFEDAKEPAHV